MTEKEEYVEVTTKVPKRLMQFLEDQDYLGWSKEEFFTMCVKRGVDCEISELDIDVVIGFERKYGIKPDLVVAFTQHKKLCKP